MAGPAGQVTAVEMNLPRLAVIVDFRVARAAGGELLLYRLLSKYPKDRLVICQSREPRRDAAAPMLEDVPYAHISWRIPRWLLLRFNPIWPVCMSRIIKKYTIEIIESVRTFKPEAILTVPHGYLWIAAASAAERMSLPLHLVYHDDWPSHVTSRKADWIGAYVRGRCTRVIQRVYRQAATRFCVSPGMEQEYRRQFGCPGNILYPSRGDDSPTARIRVHRIVSDPLVVAYAGTIHHLGNIELLKQLADLLAKLGGHLDLYVPTPQEQLDRLGLGLPNVRLMGFLPASEMGERVARTADLLFLPASFQADDRLDTSTLFPSKLTDYTAIGLPILVWAPDYSSAAQWCRENDGATILITVSDPSAVFKALQRVADDPTYSREIAAKGIEAGNHYFNVDGVRRHFLEVLASHTPIANNTLPNSN